MPIFAKHKESQLCNGDALLPVQPIHSSFQPLFHEELLEVFSEGIDTTSRTI